MLSEKKMFQMVHREQTKKSIYTALIRIIVADIVQVNTMQLFCLIKQIF